MKLTVDCQLTQPLSALQHDSALAYLLSKANKTWLDSPLEAVVCNRYGLPQMPDYPIAAVAASADGLRVGDDCWLRADPVHLMMRRDSFSLSEPVSVRREHVERLVADLNVHFGVDGLQFFIGDSGACYLRLSQVPEIDTTLPSVAVGKNMFQFLPRGVGSAKWGAYLNEMQMLLHGHSVNLERESAGEPVINSIWLSGGGLMPKNLKLNTDFDLIVADSPFYKGLAQLAGVPHQTGAMNLQEFLHNKPSFRHVQLQMSGEQQSADTGFQVLLNALKTNKLNELVLNLGWYENTLMASVSRLETFKFWRKLRPVMDFLG